MPSTRNASPPGTRRQPRTNRRRSLAFFRLIMTFPQKGKKGLAAAAAIVVALGGLTVVRAQIQYQTGQNVAPVYEGWMRNGDGSIDMVFGYLNRNWEEVLYLPIGPENNVQPGGPDRGQPTIFVPRRFTQPPGERREQFVFRVRVPAGWGPKQEVVWTLTAHGRTDKAVGTLDTLDEIDTHVIAENRAFTITEGNKPPAIQSLKADPENVTLPGTVTLTVRVTDDGLPKPPTPPPASGGNAGGRGNAAAASSAVAALLAFTGRIPGLSVKWIYYRGPGVGLVKFEPERSGPITDGQATTKVTFKAPGTYMLRALADDGALIATSEVTVTVKGGTAGSAK